MTMMMRGDMIEETRTGLMRIDITDTIDTVAQRRYAV